MGYVESVLIRIIVAGFREDGIGVGEVVLVAEPLIALVGVVGPRIYDEYREGKKRKSPSDIVAAIPHKNGKTEKEGSKHRELHPVKTSAPVKEQGDEKDRSDDRGDRKEEILPAGEGQTGEE